MLAATEPPVLRGDPELHIWQAESVVAHCDLSDNKTFFTVCRQRSPESLLNLSIPPWLRGPASPGRYLRIIRGDISAWRVTSSGVGVENPFQTTMTTAIIRHGHTVVIK